MTHNHASLTDPECSLPAVAGDLQRQLVDAGASVLLDAISQTVSHPIGLPGASQALVASVEVLLDYKGHSGWISPKYICPALETNCIGAGER